MTVFCIILVQYSLRLYIIYVLVPHYYLLFMFMTDCSLIFIILSFFCWFDPFIGGSRGGGGLRPFVGKKFVDYIRNQ